MDRKVERWRQRGAVFLWRYRDHPRSYFGWHFTADPQGNASFRELLELMIASPYASDRTIAITPPTPDVLAVPNYRRGAAQTATAWRVRYSPERDAESGWRLERIDRDVRLSLGRAGAYDLIRGLDDMSAGSGDYTLPSYADAPNDERLWVWWWLPTT